MKVAPRSATSRAASASRSTLCRSKSWISAPQRRVASRLMTAPSAGMAITAGMPRSWAAQAVAWAWLPEE